MKNSMSKGFGRGEGDVSGTGNWVKVCSYGDPNAFCDTNCGTGMWSMYRTQWERYQGAPGSSFPLRLVKISFSNLLQEQCDSC